MKKQKLSEKDIAGITGGVGIVRDTVLNESNRELARYKIDDHAEHFIKVKKKRDPYWGKYNEAHTKDNDIPKYLDIH